MADDGPAAKKACLSMDALEKLTKEELIAKYVELAASAETASAGEGRGGTAISVAELAALRESEEKLRQQHAEATRRENILIKTLTSKEQELAECASQIEELKQYQLPSNAQLRTVLLDPTVNLMFQRMRKELDASKAKQEELQNELSAWKFTPDSQTGKRLMARCRMLIQENEELGKQISSGRIAKLEGNIALERALVSEMKASQAETDEYLLELDGEMEGMQTTVYLLQQQLRETKEQLLLLRADNAQLTVRCGRAETALAEAELAEAALAAAASATVADESCRSPDFSRTGERPEDAGRCATAEASSSAVAAGEQQQLRLDGDERTAGAATSDNDAAVAADCPAEGAEDGQSVASCAASAAEAMDTEVAEVHAAAARPASIEDGACGVDCGSSKDGAARHQTRDAPAAAANGGDRLSSDDYPDAERRLSFPERGSDERSASEDAVAQPPSGATASESAAKPAPEVATPRSRYRSTRGSEASGTDDDLSQMASGDTTTSPVDDDPVVVASTSGGTRTPARRSARTKRRRVDATGGGGAADGGETSAGLLANGHASS